MPRPGNMLYLLTYDIPSTQEGDRRRAKLARYLEGVGIRVQWSVFELDIDPMKLESVCHEVEQRIAPEEDSVRVYPLCATCASRHLRIGKDAPVERGTLMIW